MPSEFREIVLDSTRYNTRQTASIPGWIGVESYDWVEGYGWSPTMVRRPQTLKRLYTALCDLLKPERNDGHVDKSQQ